MCSNLVKIALLENYLLPGMKSKSQSLRIRRREKIKVSEEIKSSCSDLEEQLQQAEYIGTQLERVDIEELVEEHGSRETNV